MGARFISKGRRVAPRYYTRDGYDKGTALADECAGRVRVRWDSGLEQDERTADLDGLRTLAGAPAMGARA